MEVAQERILSVSVNRITWPRQDLPLSIPSPPDNHFSHFQTTNDIIPFRRDKNTEQLESLIIRLCCIESTDTGVCLNTLLLMTVHVYYCCYCYCLCVLLSLLLHLCLGCGKQLKDYTGFVMGWVYLWNRVLNKRSTLSSVHPKKKFSSRIDLKETFMHAWFQRIS